MRYHPDCYTCFLNQTVEAVKISTPKEEMREETLKRVKEFLSQVSPQLSPPEVAQMVYQLIREVTGNEDPYFSVKEKYNKIALNLYPYLEERVRKSRVPLRAAVKLAGTGNIIDFGIGVEDFDLKEMIDKDLSSAFVIDDYEEFFSDLHSASNLLYLGDNAGEIVFDRILIEEIKRAKDLEVTFVVRGGPIINDVNMRDAEEVGMGRVARVISSGLDVPGTIPSRSSRELIDAYNSTDMVIAKGQGNYETLDGEEKNIFFILRAKCQVVASELKVNLGDPLLVSQVRRKGQARK